jgi:hypothetical protein
MLAACCVAAAGLFAVAGHAHAQSTDLYPQTPSQANPPPAAAYPAAPGTYVTPAPYPTPAPAMNPGAPARYPGSVSPSYPPANNPYPARTRYPVRDANGRAIDDGGRAYPDGAIQVTQQAAPMAPVSGEELRGTAIDAYIYAYPMVLMEVTRRVSTGVTSAADGRAPMNQFGHKTAFPDAHTPDTRWPSTDTLYSSLWYDVSAQPLVVRIPDAGNRYYVLSLLDMWTDTYASRGTRVIGDRPQTFAIVGPYWRGSLPPGVDIVRSPTSTGWVLAHVQTNGSADYSAVNGFQTGMTTMPYAGAGQPYPPQPSLLNFAVNPQMSPAQQVANMDANTYFSIFFDTLRNNPPHANDYPILDRMRRIGLGNGPFVFNQLDPAVQQALTQAGPEAGKRIADQVAFLGTSLNGWRMVVHGIGTYGADYTRRAAIAYAGLGAGVPEDVVYPVTRVDEKGRLLVGNDKYVLHFRRDQLPPSNAFWSLILYGSNQAFLDNAANKYAIHSTDDLKYNDDGSLDIYIQRRPPSREKQSNWLPAPGDDQVFNLNMRIYWPRAAVLDGVWAPPPVRED